MGNPKAWHRTIGARLLLFEGGILPLFRYSKITKRELGLDTLRLTPRALRFLDSMLHALCPELT